MNGLPARRHEQRQSVAPIASMQVIQNTIDLRGIGAPDDLHEN